MYENMFITNQQHWLVCMRLLLRHVSATGIGHLQGVSLNKGLHSVRNKSRAY